MWLRVASQCGSAMRVATVTDDSAVDPGRWISEQVDAACSAGALGRLYVFVREPADSPLAGAIGWIARSRRLEPVIVAPEAALASSACLNALRRAGVRTLYVTLHGATAGRHDALTGDSGSWRRALVLLTSAPRLIEQMRVGAHLALSPETAAEVPGVVRLVQKIGDCELLLWDAGSFGPETIGLEAGAALHALDVAVRAAQKLGVRIRPVGFERTRTAKIPGAAGSCGASRVVVDLLRSGIVLPSVRGGLLAVDGTSVAVAEAAPTGRAVGQLAFELAAAGYPLLDLPACLGGPPPEKARAHAAVVKPDACSCCPLDSGCAGVPRVLMGISGLGEEVRPPRHWLALRQHPRVLVLCPVVSEGVYGATFFSLARALAGRGARVDVVSPWAVHAGIPASFSEHQPRERPEGATEVEKYVSDGPVDRYDLIVTPDLETAHLLVAGRRLPDGVRLAVTDFHMLRGMDEWVREWCSRGQRAEEGGWWPSDQVVLYSAFPGYAPLYARYGIPMRQVVWQPYALDRESFPVELSAVEGTSIVSGGRHLRDIDTLLSAAALLGGRVHPIDLFADGSLDAVPSGIRFCGAVPTSEFCAAVGRSRFMVVPVLEDPHRAAGITAMATAIMCGRPIVATDTAAARDYVSEGVNGLLVPAGDPRALAEAIKRLDSDSVLLSTLAGGARAAAARLGTEAWAGSLLRGSRTYDREHWIRSR